MDRAPSAQSGMERGRGLSLRLAHRGQTGSIPEASMATNIRFQLSAFKKHLLERGERTIHAASETCAAAASRRSSVVDVGRDGAATRLETCPLQNPAKRAMAAKNLAAMAGRREAPQQLETGCRRFGHRASIRNLNLNLNRKGLCRPFRAHSTLPGGHRATLVPRLPWAGLFLGRWPAWITSSSFRCEAAQGAGRSFGGRSFRGR